MVSDKQKIDSLPDDSWCLPDDVLYMIVLCLPADFLYNVMSLVNRQWYNLIRSPTFISAHLEKHSTTDTNALLIGINGYLVKPRSDHLGGCVLELKDLNFRFVQKVCASCNGLLFVVGPRELTIRCPSYVVNLVTKEYLPLPLFPSQLSRHNFSFAYAAASRVYKLMHYSDNQSSCLILTVGVDTAWREVDISELSDTRMEVMMCAYQCLTLRGFVYWLSPSASFILSFDMEAETFGEIPIFPEFDTRTYGVGLLAMGSSLCVWVQDLTEEYLFKFWLLKNPESGDGQWEKLVDVNVEGERRFKSIWPINWLRSMELLVFCSSTEIMVYHVNTGKVYQTKEMKKPKTKNICFSRIYSEPHVESLVPLKNLSLVMTAGRPHKSQAKVYSEENMKAEFEELTEPSWCNFNNSRV